MTSAPAREPLSDADRRRLQASKDNSARAVSLLGVILFGAGGVLLVWGRDNLAAALAKAVIPLALALLCAALAYLLARGNSLIAADLREGYKQPRHAVLSKKLAVEDDLRLVFGELQVQVSAKEYELAEVGQCWELWIAPRSKLVLQRRPLSRG